MNFHKPANTQSRVTFFRRHGRDAMEISLGTPSTAWRWVSGLAAGGSGSFGTRLGWC